MPISHNKKIIFIHIPKTAGQSMEIALGLDKKNELYGFEDGDGNRFSNEAGIRISGLERKKRKIICLQHLGAVEIKKKYKREIWDNYFKFAFVRNPWDRVVSEYHYISQQRKDLRELLGLSLGDSFIDYVNKINVSKKIETQLSYISDENKNIIVDFAGKFENLDKDFQKVCQKINFSGSLKKVNASGHKHYQEYYTEAAKRMIGRLYGDDIKAFGYEF